MQSNVKYTITSEQLDKIISDYMERGGEVVYLNDGSLTQGTIIFRNNGAPLWEFVSWEEYRNEWTSWQMIRKYRKLPKKWHKIANDYIEKLYAEEA